MLLHIEVLLYLLHFLIATGRGERHHYFDDTASLPVFLNSGSGGDDHGKKKAERKAPTAAKEEP